VSVVVVLVVVLVLVVLVVPVVLRHATSGQGAPLPKYCREKRPFEAVSFPCGGGSG